MTDIGACLHKTLSRRVGPKYDKVPFRSSFVAEFTLFTPYTRDSHNTPIFREKDICQLQYQRTFVAYLVNTPFIEWKLSADLSLTFQGQNNYIALGDGYY